MGVPGCGRDWPVALWGACLDGGGSAQGSTLCFLRSWLRGEVNNAPLSAAGPRFILKFSCRAFQMTEIHHGSAMMLDSTGLQAPTAPATPFPAAVPRDPFPVGSIARVPLHLQLLCPNRLQKPLAAPWWLLTALPLSMHRPHARSRGDCQACGRELASGRLSSRENLQ